MARQIGPCPRRGGSRKGRWLGPRSKRGGVPPPSPRHARRPRELRRARPRRATRTSVSRRAAASSTSASRQPAASAPAAALPLETGAANAKTAANASRSAPAAGAARGRAAANRMRASGIAGEPRGGWDPRASPPRGEATPKVVARGGSWPLRGAPRTPAPSRRPTGACEGGTPLNRPVSAARCARAAPGEARRTAWQQVRASGRGFSDPAIFWRCWFMSQGPFSRQIPGQAIKNNSSRREGGAGCDRQGDAGRERAQARAYCGRVVPSPEWVRQARKCRAETDQKRTK